MAQADSEIRPDICVIGAGAGGLAAAAAAAAMGVPVVLIERDRMGGESLNTGAVPSKAFVAAAQRAHDLRKGERLGVTSIRSAVDFAGVNAHVRRAIEAIAPQSAAERFTGLGVRVIAGAARFADPRTVTVGDVAVRARRFIIATGSRPDIPPIPGLDDTPYLTPRTVFDLTESPRHLIVIGAGREGLELAQAFRRLGSNVTILEAAAPLQTEDRECTAVVLDALTREGIVVRAGVQITQVRRVLARIQVVLARPDGGNSGGDELVDGTHVLIAAGRRPNTEGLGLDDARIRHDGRGVAVNKHLRTSNRRVYAIGDVIGGPRFTHLAAHHAGLVVRNALFRHSVRVDRRSIPRVTHTDPELAQVGLTEDEARATARTIHILRWSYRENDRALTAGATDGHVKVLTDRRGEILGATIVGAGAGEIISAWTLGVAQRLNIAAFAGLVLPYPSYAEVGKRAAITYYMGRLTSAPVRRIIGWLRRLG
jgi:pyruvate/2-oxoglutarate dehydrogenase complex dihydrolipoamide dehydrogenase (E3) component